MAAGELNNDEQPAPLPAHERGWRHPSEIGQASWVTTEPPIRIGRGLTATTGGIGLMLALAVLWTTLPTQAGRSAVVSVRSTLAAGSVVVSDSLRQPPATTAASTLAPITANSTGTATTAVPSPADLASPMPTYNLQQTKTLQGGAIAVAVTGSSLVITTAYAVEADDNVQIHLTDGSSEMAHVLFVDQDSGLAVLATSFMRTDVTFKVAEIAPGDKLTLMGATAYTFTIGATGTFDQEIAYDDSVREGTPVTNQRGDLVGLCSMSSSAPFVALGDLSVLQRLLAGWSGKIWMGIVFNANKSGQLVIDAVDPGGPAERAGLHAGDIIVAIDGTPVADNATFVQSLAGVMPGDSVQLTVRYANGDDATVVLQLGAS